MSRDLNSRRCPRKVCFIAHQVAGRSGGAERVLIETANAMAERGHQVEILVHEKSNHPPFYPLRFGVTLTNLRRPDAVRSKLRLRFDRWREQKLNLSRSFWFPMGHIIWLSKHGAFWRRLERHINLHRPDVAIAFLPPSIVALGKIRPAYQLRRIASLHNVPQRDLCDPARWDPSPLDRRQRMSALRRHDAITVLQPEFRDWFSPDLREKISIVPNVVRQVSTARITRHSRENTVLSVGRLAGVKRYGLLIEAWTHIVDEFPEWTLKIFGKGPLQRELQAQIAEQGLVGKVRLMGHTSDIDREYLAASIVAHPAEHEGWGLAASEALAAGVPVIGFEYCPGINHLVKHQINGLLVQDGQDPARSFAEALAELMSNQSKRLEYADAAPGTVREYSPEKVYDRWEDLLYTPAQVRDCTDPRSADS